MREVTREMVRTASRNDQAATTVLLAARWLESHPDDLGILLDYAEMLFQMTRYEDAIRLYLNALEKAEGNRRARQQHHQCDGENDQALGGRAHSISPTASLTWARAISSTVAFGGSPNGGSRPVTSLMISAMYCRLMMPSPIGMHA